MKILKRSIIPKGSYFIEAGQIPKKFAFVSSGLFRYLYVDNKGNEYTKNFIPNDHFLSSYSAMITGSASKMYIEALEDSEVYEINYALWLKLKTGHSCWNIFLVSLLEKAFSIKENRERELLLLEANERYEIFKKQFPGLDQKIPQYQVASYLGITPTQLSRIRKKN